MRVGGGLRSDHLLCLTSEPMPLINRRVANHSISADCFWCWLHYAARVLKWPKV
jgi:hypothetical protein